MQIKPVTKANKPEYPTASEIDIPKVLNASKPKKWKRNAAIGAVMLGMIFGTGGCEKSIYEKSISDKDYYFVAPMFHRGTGVGSFGCMVVSPPVYLSETEAKQIIYSEFAKEDLYLDTVQQPRTKIIIKSIDYGNRRQFIGNLYFEELPEQSNLLSFNELEMQKKSGTKMPKKFRPEPQISKWTLINNILKFDAYLQEANLGIVFVSSDKYNMLIDDTLDNYSTVYRFDIKKVSEKIIKAVNNKPVSLATFYDPVIRPMYNGIDDKDYFEEMKKAVAISKDSLRAQVRDFLAWYKENKGKK